MLVPYLFIAPNITLFTAFSFLPLIYAVYISFHDWTLIGEPNFIAIRNYLRLVHDPLFWRALANTLLYAGSHLSRPDHGDQCAERPLMRSERSPRCPLRAPHLACPHIPIAPWQRCTHHQGRR